MLCLPYAKLLLECWSVGSVSAQYIEYLETLYYVFLTWKLQSYINGDFVIKV